MALALTFTEPTAGAWQALDGVDGIAGDMKAIAIIAGVPEPAIGALGVRDFRAAARAAAAVVEVDAAFAQNDDQSPQLVITLRSPVQLGDETLAELKLHEPSVQEWRRWEGLSGTAADIKAVETITGA